MSFESFCYEKLHKDDSDHCENVCHAFSFQDAIRMLAEQLDISKPAHFNGYALCINDFPHIGLDPPGVSLSCKDDGFCCHEGNYLCWEDEDEARKALEYYRSMCGKQMADYGEYLYASKNGKMVKYDALVSEVFPVIAPDETFQQLMKHNEWKSHSDMFEECCEIHYREDFPGRPGHEYLVSLRDAKNGFEEDVYCLSFIECLHIMRKLLPGIEALKGPKNDIIKKRKRDDEKLARLT